MKKLMIAMAAVAMVGAANAAASYEYNHNMNLGSGYSEKDTTPGSDHASWYSGYAMTQKTAQDLLNTTKTVDYNDMADWLKQNFAENSEDVKAASQALSAFVFNSSLGGFYLSMDDGLDDFEGYDWREDYIGVAFFNDGKNQAYQVWGGDAGGCNFDFGDSKCSTEWIAVPEPTSGLLMLLGMAGLALKRRRA